MSDKEQLIMAGQVDGEMTFREKVWAVTTRIPKGKVVTYGDIAKVLGSNACRAVGTAMATNPYIPAVPCHRVVGSTGRIGGYALGPAKKEAILKSEDVEVCGSRVDLEKYRFDFGSI